MATEHKRDSCNKLVTWLDVAFAACRGKVATIHPIDIGIAAPCFGITLERCWVQGSEGELTVFETPQAARRFLELLGIAHPEWRDGGKTPPLPHEKKFHLFQLRRYSLKSCGTGPAFQ